MTVLSILIYNNFKNPKISFQNNFKTDNKYQYIGFFFFEIILITREIKHD